MDRLRGDLAAWQYSSLAGPSILDHLDFRSTDLTRHSGTVDPSLSQRGNIVRISRREQCCSIAVTTLCAVYRNLLYHSRYHRVTATTPQYNNHIIPQRVFRCARDVRNCYRASLSASAASARSELDNERSTNFSWPWTHRDDE